MTNVAPRLSGIEALRGYAACAIIFLHASTTHPIELPFWFYGFRTYLRLGVPLFFVVSSFSLYYAYSRRLRDAQSAKAYFVRRFLRIAPLFYAVIILWSAYCYLVGSPLRPLNEYLLNVTFLFGLMPGTHTSIVPAGWSIGVETIFYAMFPIILLFVRSIASSLIALAISIFLAFEFGVHLTSLYVDLPFYSWASFIPNLPYFFCGALAFHVFEALSQSTRKLHVAAISLLLAAVTGATLVVVTVVQTTGPVPFSTYGWGAVFALVVLSQALHPFALVSNPLTTFLGKISFSLYLLHPILIQASPVTFWINDFPIGPNTKLGFNSLYAMAMTIPVAWLAYTFIEAPFMRLSRCEFRKYGFRLIDSTRKWIHAALRSG